MKRYLKKIVMGCGALLLAALPLKGSAAMSLNGAGATFPYPLYSKWFHEYNKINPSVEINYQSIGSGGGIKQITERTVDFGASDAPMSDYDLTNVKAPILHIPTVLGAVVLAYNVPQISGELKLNSAVIADIFLGNIKKWNDPKLVALNPDKTLPAGDIMVVHRSDGSGTSYVFTDYLSKVSRAWKMKAGTGKSVNWPAGLGAKGNEGVTGMVKQTPGSIGYIELGYAMENKIPFATIQNKAGNFVTPSVASVSAAATGVKIPADYRVSLTDSDGKDAYPISSFTYLLVYQKQPDATKPESGKGKVLVDFLKWAMRDGQKMAPTLFYSPLPAEVVSRVEETIAQITSTTP